MDGRAICGGQFNPSQQLRHENLHPSRPKEWFGTAQGMIEFRRCLVQALDIKSSEHLGPQRSQVVVLLRKAGFHAKGGVKIKTT